jgi:hypothetical protein
VGHKFVRQVLTPVFTTQPGIAAPHLATGAKNDSQFLPKVPLTIPRWQQEHSFKKLSLPEVSFVGNQPVHSFAMPVSRIALLPQFQEMN